MQQRIVDDGLERRLIDLFRKRLTNYSSSNLLSLVSFIDDRRYAQMSQNLESYGYDLTLRKLAHLAGTSISRDPDKDELVRVIGSLIGKGFMEADDLKDIYTDDPLDYRKDIDPKIFLRSDPVSTHMQMIDSDRLHQEVKRLEFDEFYEDNLQLLVYMLSMQHEIARYFIDSEIIPLDARPKDDFLKKAYYEYLGKIPTVEKLLTQTVATLCKARDMGYKTDLLQI